MNEWYDRKKKTKLVALLTICPNCEKLLKLPMFYASNPGLYCIRPIIIHHLDLFAFFSVPVCRNLDRCL